MAITPLEQYGTISRTQDFSVHRLQEEVKENSQQQLIQNEQAGTADQKLNQVRSGDEAKMAQSGDQGNGSGYAGDGGRNRKKKEKQSDGKVILKGMGSFDMKI